MGYCEVRGMIIRIKKIDILPDYELLVAFDDGRVVLYDVKEDIRTMPGFAELSNGLFQNAQLDESRTCIFWTPEIDLPSDAIYEYGIPVYGPTRYRGDTVTWEFHGIR